MTPYEREANARYFAAKGLYPKQEDRAYLNTLLEGGVITYEVVEENLGKNAAQAWVSLIEAKDYFFKMARKHTAAVEEEEDRTTVFTHPDDGGSLEKVTRKSVRVKIIYADSKHEGNLIVSSMDGKGKEELLGGYSNVGLHYSNRNYDLFDKIVPRERVLNIYSDYSATTHMDLLRAINYAKTDGRKLIARIPIEFNPGDGLDGK